MKDKIFRSVMAAELLLLVPLVSNLFTDAFQWNVFDYAVVSVLLAGIGIAAALVLNGVENKRHALIGFVLAAAMVLLWAELAVGIFGSPIAGS